ncbi:MAG: BolA family protein [Myxococcota bacterium]
MQPAERREWIERTLAIALEPEAIEVEDESHLHRGHAGAAGGGGHFRVRVVSGRFRDRSRLERHRIVYGALAVEMGSGIHALALETLTPEEA